MKKIKYGSLCLCALLMASCYEDEGNYSYNEGIEDIHVKLEKVYGMKKSKQKTTYTITPEITTPDNDKSYLEYLWTKNTVSENYSQVDTIGTSESVDIEIDPADKKFSYKHYIRLVVKDKRYNTETLRNTVLEIVKPYSYAWAILHEKDGHAEIGTVEYVGNEIFVTPDTYTKEQGKSLTGKPLCMEVVQGDTHSYDWGYDAMSRIFINTTNVEESGLYNQVEGFSLRHNWKQLLHPAQLEGLDLSDMKLYQSPGTGLVMLCNGKAFNNIMFSPFLFQMVDGPNLLHGTDFSILLAGPHTAVGYDQKNHRFLHLALQYSGFWFGVAQSGISPGAMVENIRKKTDNAIDPDHVDESIDFFASCNGYKYSQRQWDWMHHTGYMYGLGAGNISHVIVFQYYGLTNSKATSIPYHFEFITPEGVDKNTVFTSGPQFNNMLFYGAGNKVYKLDVSTGRSTMIYQHDDSTAKINFVKMATEGYTQFNGSDNDGTPTHGHPYARTLGVAVNKMDGTADFVILQLNAAGKVDVDQKFPSIQVHKGFGPIKDIDFL